MTVMHLAKAPARREVTYVHKVQSVTIRMEIENGEHEREREREII